MTTASEVSPSVAMIAIASESFLLAILTHPPSRRLGHKKQNQQHSRSRMICKICGILQAHESPIFTVLHKAVLAKLGIESAFIPGGKCHAGGNNTTESYPSVKRLVLRQIGEMRFGDYQLFPHQMIYRQPENENSLVPP